MLSKKDYEKWTQSTRDIRMDWWRQARFGLFIHYGLYSILGRHEWAMADENIPIEEYEALTKEFHPKEGCCKEWAKLAKDSGAKYMVMVTRHHDGFSLWDSKVNPYNSMNVCGRDLVKEFVDACHEMDLKVGFYSSLMEWHHPDSWTCAYDVEARNRYLRYIQDLNIELLSNYGKIDILWYDMPEPMESAEGWDSLSRNQKLRELQPDILINDRSRLLEDFGTPEESVQSENRDWEACMTFNGISWGYVDSEMAKPYSYNASQIIAMLQKCCAGSGNLLLNVGPKADGSLPEECITPLTTVGKWLQENGSAVYGHMRKQRSISARSNNFGGNGICRASAKGHHIYLWNLIWPKGGTMAIGGYFDRPIRIKLVKDGTLLDYEYKGQRIILKNLPSKAPDEHAGITIIDMEFEHEPKYYFASYYPQLSQGHDTSGGKRI